MSDVVKKVVSLCTRIFDALRPVAPLLTRLVLGIAFFGAGLGKWKNMDRTAAFFDSIGIPAPAANAAFIATLELVGGIALILGLGTRAFAALLSCTMIVAMMTADRPDLVAALTPGSDKGLMDVVPLPFLLLLLWLVAFGAGPWSLDRVLPRARRA